MWTPAKFREDDTASLHALVDQHPFGLLVTCAGGRASTTHLPFLLDRERGPLGTLVAHMARANPHWRSLGESATVVFRGPHAYVSPAWYADRDTVPTWNYAVVHAEGPPRLVEEPARLRSIVERLTRIHEERAGTGWEPGPALERELPGIVGFEIPIRALEGKFKLNQNRSAADRRGVVQALERSDDPLARGVAQLMARRLED